MKANLWCILEPNKQSMSPSKCIKSFVYGEKGDALATA